jgi:replicative superfamily II helicase
VSISPLTQVKGKLHGFGNDLNYRCLLVVIKGTQVYDSSKGQFADLSILDVLQVFGRAGRPGLETSGEGYICTTEDRLPHYLNKVTSQVFTLARFMVPFC